MEGDDQPMQVDSSKITLSVLEIVNEARNMYGIRQNEYVRYGRFCAGKIRRLRKAAGLVQGTKKTYEKKPVEKSDRRSLLILLFQGERWWSRGMELREKGVEGRSRSLMKRQFDKSVQFAHQLHIMSRDVVDEMSAKETYGYWMTMDGVRAMEREDWTSAYERVRATRDLYDTMSRECASVKRILCERFVEEMDGSIRYIEYQLRYLGDHVNSDASREFTHDAVQIDGDRRAIKRMKRDEERARVVASSAKSDERMRTFERLLQTESHVDDRCMHLIGQKGILYDVSVNGIQFGKEKKGLIGMLKGLFT